MDCETKKQCNDAYSDWCSYIGQKNESNVYSCRVVCERANLSSQIFTVPQSRTDPRNDLAGCFQEISVAIGVAVNPVLCYRPLPKCTNIN